jgi:peptidoglycan/xylan/chitin deacetylase (PgdA/CDA1 family)
MRRYHTAAVARKIASRPARFSWPAGVVSFTFDDFPKSSIAVGGRIPEGYGVPGTYYVSMNLAGTERIVGRMFDHEDVCATHSVGHEIACHTYAHLDCCASPKRSILAEMVAAARSSGLGGSAPTNFAYLYGRVSPVAKRVLGPLFLSCRGTCEDINYGILDLADLLAILIYSSVFGESKMRWLIDRNWSLDGWFTFIRMTSSRRRRDLGAGRSSWRLPSPTPQNTRRFCSCTTLSPILNGSGKSRGQRLCKN